MVTYKSDSVFIGHGKGSFDFVKLAADAEAGKIMRTDEGFEIPLQRPEFDEHTTTAEVAEVFKKDLGMTVLDVALAQGCGLEYGHAAKAPYVLNKGRASAADVTAAVLWCVVNKPDVAATGDPVAIMAAYRGRNG